MSAALSAFKLSVQSVRQLQQHKIEVSFELSGLPHQWTRVANCWSKAVFSSALLVGFGIYNVSVLHLTW